MYSYLLGVLFFVALVDGRVWYNSQISPPYNIRLSDLTGDTIQDFVIHEGDKLFTTSSDFIVRGLTFNKLDGAISRTITGKFDGGSQDLVCAQIPTLNRLICHRYYSSANYLYWIFYQGDFIGTNQAIVGDFDGDGRDDILVYTPSAGTFAMHRWNPTTSFFEPMTNWAAGNLTNFNLANMQVRAGNFGHDSKTDLMFYNPSNGQAIVFLSRLVGSSFTHRWHFTTATGWGLADEEIAVADLDGDGLEDVILHNVVTGGYYTCSVTYDAGSQGMTNLFVDIGDLHTGINSYVYFTKTKNIPGEDSGKTNIRDDAMVYSADWQLWIRSQARYNSTTATQTYKWAYTQYLIRLNQDQDGDAILTKHELGGYDPNNDGVSNVPLHTYGASPFYKDIFVEADYMAAAPGRSWNYAMLPAATTIAVNSFADKEINLHVFSGNQVPYQANLGNPGFNWVTHFDPIKNANFATDRWYFFHYCLLGNAYNGGTSSGISRGIGASDFIVTLGTYHTNANDLAGTFLHELGHNLGIRHGGTDDVNYKPNHLSIMNYNYQFDGIYKNGVYRYSYSDVVCNSLNENALNENNGVQCATGTNTYWTYIQPLGIWDQVNTNFDWNQNGVLQTSVSRDTNSDGSLTTLTASVNEYTAINYGGGYVGDAAYTRRQVYQDDEKILYEPPIEEIIASRPIHKTESMATDSESQKQLNAAPHTGFQFLDSSLRRPSIIKDNASAFISTPVSRVASSPSSPSSSSSSSSSSPPSSPPSEAGFEGPGSQFEGQDGDSVVNPAPAPSIVL